MRVYCITINSFTLIPVTRFIIGLFANRFYTEVVECTIKDQSPIEGVKKKTTIGKFSNSKDLNTQTTFFKLWKYAIVSLKFFSLLFKNKIIIYTPDIQVLCFGLWIKKIFKRKGWKIVYHQFELIEEKYLQKKDLKLWTFILKNIHLVDLSIIPEINRLHYFLNVTKQGKSNTLLFTNTCEAHDFSVGMRHSGLTRISDSSIVFGHIGNVGLDHYFKAFISIIEMCSIYDNVFFIIAGRHSGKVIDQFKNVKNVNLIFLGELPHNQLKTVYPLIDYGFILYKGVDLNFEYCAPNKLYEYWSFGIPVLAHPLIGLQPLFDNPVKGRLFNFETADLAKEISAVIMQGKPNKAHLKNLFEEKLDIKKELIKLDNKILSIL